MPLISDEETFNQNLQQASAPLVDPSVAAGNEALQAGFNAGLEDEGGTVIPLDTVETTDTLEIPEEIPLIPVDAPIAGVPVPLNPEGVDRVTVDTRDPDTDPIPTTKTMTQELPQEEPVKPVVQDDVLVTEEDMALFQDIPEGVDPGVGSEMELFKDVDSGLTVGELEKNEQTALFAEWETKRLAGDVAFSDMPVDVQTKVLEDRVDSGVTQAVLDTVSTMKYFNALAKGPKALGPAGIGLGVLDRLAGRGLRGGAMALDFLTYPIAFGMGKIPGLSEPSFLRTLEYYIPKENSEFPDAPDLLVDEALNIAGMTAEFVGGGAAFTGAFAGVSRVLGKLLPAAGETVFGSTVTEGAAVSTKGFNTISDDLLFSLESQAAFDTLAGASFQGTREMLDEDSIVLPIVNSMLIPLAATKGGRGLLWEGTKLSGKALDKVTQITVVRPLIITPFIEKPLKQLGTRLLDNRAEAILIKNASIANAKDVAGEVVGRWSPKGQARRFKESIEDFSMTWATNRVNNRAGGLTDAMIAEDAKLYFKELINFDDPRVKERTLRINKIQDSVNDWVKQNPKHEKLTMYVPLAYRGVVDNAGVDYLDHSFRTMFPEVHLRDTRQRVETLSAYIRAKGTASTADEVAMLSQLGDDLEFSLNKRMASEKAALTPGAIRQTSDIGAAQETTILTAGQMRRNIVVLDDIADETYGLLTAQIDRSVPLSSERVLATIDDIIARDAKNILSDTKEVPAYVIDVYQGVKSKRPEAELTPREARHAEIITEKRDIDLHAADRKIAHLEEIGNVDAGIAVAQEKISNLRTQQVGPKRTESIKTLEAEVNLLKKERAHSEADQKKFTASNTAKKKLLIAEEKQSEAVIKKEKLELGTTDQVALLADLVPVNTGEVIDSIKRVNKLLRDAHRSMSPDTVLIENLEKVKVSLNDTMQDLKAKGKVGAAALQLWETANSFYKNQIANPIDSTVLGNKYLSRTKDGKQFAQYDEDIVETAWTSAKLKDIEDTINLQFVAKDISATLKNLDEVLLAEKARKTADAILQDYRDLGVSSLMGELSKVNNTLGKNLDNPEKYMELMKQAANQWMSANSAKVNRIPGLKTEIDRILMNNEEFFQRIVKYVELDEVVEGNQFGVLMDSMGHSSKIGKIIVNNESSNSLATTIEGFVTDGYRVPKVAGVEIQELAQFEKVLGVQAARNFKDLIHKQYISSVWDSSSSTLNAVKVRADLDNASTRANMIKIMGDENVLMLDNVSDSILLGGLDDTVTTNALIKSGEEGVYGAILDKALTLVSANQQKITSLGSLAMRRARGFAPSAEWFQVYLGTEAIKHLGNKSQANFIKHILTDHRRLGNIDGALDDLQRASNAAIAKKIFESGGSYHQLPVSFRNDSATALRRVLQSMGIVYSHEDAMALVESVIETEGGRKERRPVAEDIPAPEKSQEPELKSSQVTPEIPVVPPETPEVPDIPRELIANGETPQPSNAA